MMRSSAAPTHPEPRVGDAVVVDASHPGALLFGMTGRITGRSPEDPKLSLVELDVDMLNLSRKARDAANVAYSRGINSDHLICIPHNSVVRINRAYRAFAANHRLGSPYSANIVADSGANVFISSVTELFSYLVELPEHERSVEGISDSPLRCTHKGHVTMKMNSFERKFMGLYVPSQHPFTLVPLYMFGEGNWHFVGRDQMLEIYHTDGARHTHLAGRFPRNIEVAPELNHPLDLLSSCGPRLQGRRLHSLYPMPDKVMVWHKEAPEIRSDEKSRGRPVKLSPSKPKSKTAKSSSSKEDAASLQEPHAEVPNDMTAQQPPPLGGTVYVWADPEDVSSRKTNVILRGIRELDEFHSLAGHHSHPTAALQYAWVYGKVLPVEVRDNMRRCLSCDKAKIMDEKFRNEALLSLALGDEYSADTIDRMPVSHSGYRYLGTGHERHSAFGGYWMGKTKQMSDNFIFWIGLCAKYIGRSPLRVKVDAGEYYTSDLIAFCKKMQTEIVKNIPDVHSNVMSEGTHRPVKDMINAMLDRGGANEACWEFCVPQVFFIRNISIPPAELRRVGYPAEHKVRPLTPFEKVVNKQSHLDIKALWDNLGGALFELVTGYIDANTGHECRGFDGINLGIIPTEKIAVASYGVNVLRMGDMKIVPCRRVVRHRGVFPWRPAPQRALPPPDDEAELSDVESSGGEGASDDEQEAMDTAPLPITEPSKGEVPTPVKPKPRVGPEKPPGGPPMAKRRPGRPPRKSRVPKFSPGVEVMTTGGPAIILEALEKGEYLCKWALNHEPGDVFRLARRQFWLVRDYPGWVFNHKGDWTNRGRGDLVKIQKRAKPLAEHKVQESKAEIKMPEPPPVDAPAARTRSRAKLAYARVYDSRYPDGVRDMEYPDENAHPECVSVWLAKKGRSAAPVVPADFPLQPTTDDLRKMPAADVAAILPRHYHQTLRSPLRAACAEGELRELQDCLNRGVWAHPVKVTADKIIIGLMWVYAVKEQKDKDQSGLFDRVRSRITLMGNQERNHLPALEAYAPVAQMVTARVLLASHIHISDIILRKLDVKNAYINENMRRVVFCRLPPGYTWMELKGGWILRPLTAGEKADPTWCLPLVKALYGGMECGRIFWEAWVDWHLEHGFQIIHEERCYLTKRHPSDGSYIKLVYHVDDNLVVARGEEYYQQYLAQVTKKFDVDEGPLVEHLGVYYNFDRAQRTITMSQRVQVEKVLKQFGMENCKSENAPCRSEPLPTAEDASVPNGEPFDMMGFVGHITWLYQCTRPDVGMVLKILSRVTQQFGKVHVQFAKHLLRYLQGTKAQVLRYVGGYPLYYQIFTDASHASCPDTRRSILSIVVKLGGMTVYWKNSYSKIVSHSSCESELFALDIGATTGQCLRWLLQAMGGPVQGMIQIFVDNQGTINISSNPVQSGRNLHVHARYFYVRDLVYGKEYELCHLPTSQQVADVGCTFKGNANFKALLKLLIDTARIVHDESDIPQWESLGPE